MENCCANFELDSKIFEEWIAHCIRKHVKGGVKPIMKREQCIAAAFKKLRAGELERRGDSMIVVYEADSNKILEILTDIKEGAPSINPKS